MLVLTGHFDLEAEQIADAVALAQQLAQHCARAPGCLQYSFAVDVLNPGRLHVIEYWTDDECLARHLESGETQDFRQQFSALCVNEVAFRVHEAVDLRNRVV